MTARYDCARVSKRISVGIEERFARGHAGGPACPAAF